MSKVNVRMFEGGNPMSLQKEVNNFLNAPSIHFVKALQSQSECSESGGPNVLFTVLYTIKKGDRC